VRHGFSLADIRSLTVPELQSYIDLLTGRTSTGGQRFVNRRLKGR